MKRSYYVVGLIMLTFFVISLLTNIIGPLIPDIIEDFDLSLALVAVLPFAFFIAFGVASIPAGMLVERYTAKSVSISAFALAFCGTGLLAMYPDYLVAVVSLFLIGMGMAMLQVALHPILRVAGGEEHFAFNNVLGQLFFGLASFLSPLLYSYLVLNLGTGDQNLLLDLLSRVVPPDLPWISLYWIFAMVCLVMIGILSASPIPSIELTEEEQVGPVRAHLDLLQKPLVILYFIGIVSYVGVEQGVANWMSEFLSSYHGLNPQTEGAAAVSLFWGLMTAGTLLGLPALKLLDSRRVLVGFSTATIICFSFGLFGSASVARLALPAVGFFISVMWSVIFALALNSVREHHGSFSGILITGIVGGAVLPLAVGWIGDLAGLRIGMLFLYVGMAYILSIGFWADPLITNKTILQKSRARDLT